MSRMEDKQATPKVTMFGPGGGGVGTSPNAPAKDRTPVQVPERLAQYRAG